MYNSDYQHEILSLLSKNKKFAIEYGDLLKPYYFDSEYSKILFSLIIKYVLAYNQEIELNHLCLLITEYVQNKGLTNEVATVLHNEAKEIFKTYIKSEQFIIDKLIKFTRTQELKDALLQSVNIIESDGNYEEILQLINKAVAIGSGVEDGLSFNDFPNFPALYNKKYCVGNLVRTGYPTYDDAMLGGFAPGEVHSIIGMPKSGKTTMACNIGAYVLISGKTVFHVTLEISEIDIIAKYITRFTGMTYSELITTNENVYKERIKKFVDRKPNLFVKYYTENTINILTIRSWVSKIMSKNNVKPDIIIVDYDDLLLPIGGGTKGDMYNNAGDVYSDLKMLADYYSCCILTLSQPNRESWQKFETTDEFITSDNIAHSAKKVHKAFSMSSLNFKRGKNTGVLYVDLNRRGKSNIKVPLERDFSKALIMENIPKDEK